ncbi:hypothetical protein N0Y54_30245 [Nostoc punctiforme UO1]
MIKDIQSLLLSIYMMWVVLILLERSPYPKEFLEEKLGVRSLFCDSTLVL